MSFHLTKELELENGVKNAALCFVIRCQSPFISIKCQPHVPNFNKAPNTTIGIAQNFASLNFTASIIFAAMKILMVCLGNICRSPLAEGVLQYKAQQASLNWVVDSAGTNGYHNGEAPHQLSQRVAKLNGINISHQRSRKLTPEDFDRFDRIFAMAEDVVDEMKRIGRNKFNPLKVDLLMNELYPGENREVPDPWAGPEEGYHEVYNMINQACDKIIEQARSNT
jgi:protein-tyrosine phosphatase